MKKIFVAAFMFMIGTTAAYSQDAFHGYKEVHIPVLDLTVMFSANGNSYQVYNAEARMVSEGNYNDQKKIVRTSNYEYDADGTTLKRKITTDVLKDSETILEYKDNRPCKMITSPISRRSSTPTCVGVLDEDGLQDGVWVCFDAGRTGVTYVTYVHGVIK